MLEAISSEWSTIGPIALTISAITVVGFAIQTWQLLRARSRSGMQAERIDLLERERDLEKEDKLKALRRAERAEENARLANPATTVTQMHEFQQRLNYSALQTLIKKTHDQDAALSEIYRLRAEQTAGLIPQKDGIEIALDAERLAKAAYNLEKKNLGIRNAEEHRAFGLANEIRRLRDDFERVVANEEVSGEWFVDGDDANISAQNLIKIALRAQNLGSYRLALIWHLRAYSILKNSAFGREELQGVALLRASQCAGSLGDYEQFLTIQSAGKKLAGKLPAQISVPLSFQLRLEEINRLYVEGNANLAFEQVGSLIEEARPHRDLLDNFEAQSLQLQMDIGISLGIDMVQYSIDAVESSTKEFGEHSNEAFFARSRHVKALIAAGEREKATSIAEDLFKLMMGRLGPENPDTMQLFALMMEAKGELPEGFHNLTLSPDQSGQNPDFEELKDSLMGELMQSGDDKSS